MSWHHKTGEIKGTYTVPEQQRRGVATSLFQQAHGQGVVKPKHSSFRTNSGDAWARSMGGRLPPRNER